jgi:hypothetical protein
MNELNLWQLVSLAAIIWLLWALIKCGETQISVHDDQGPQEQSACQALEREAEPKRSRQQRGHRQPRTKTPDDCPLCCESSSVAGENIDRTAVIAYTQRKSKRGRPKRSLTEGYCCHNPACEYREIRDSHMHALVEDGNKLTGQGLVKQIKCQWCGSKFLATRDTPMYCSKLSVARVGEINRGLAEGLSISACARVFGHSRITIQRLACVSGDHFQSLQELLLQGLKAVHVQMDELRAKLKRRVDAIWTWVSMEASNKLILAVHAGQRTQANAYTLVHKATQTLAKGCIPTYASDGLKLYYAALVAHHGQWVGDETLLPARGETGRRHRQRRSKMTWCVDHNLNYAQVVKCYARRKIKQISHRMVLGSHAVFCAIVQSVGLSGRINTSYVERLNLGLRTGVSALIRRSASTVCSELALTRRVEIYRAIYHFVRPHAGLRVALSASPHGHRYRRFEPRTPAMAAGITDRLWSMEQLLLHPAPSKAVPEHQTPRLAPVR